jgi:hypothetical protein
MFYTGKRYKQLTAFEGQILRRVYGPVQTEEGWRIRNSDELEKLMDGEDIVEY